MLFGKYINKFYKKYGILMLIGALFLIGVDWLQLYIPQYTGQIINVLADGNVTSEDLALIGRLGVYIVLIGLGIFLGRLGWRFTILYSGRKIEADIRKDMFIKATKLSVSYYHDNKVGTVMALFTNDLEQVSECFGWGTNMIIDSLFLLSMTLVKMFVVNWALTLIALLPICLIVVWGALVEKIFSEKWEQRQKVYDSLYDYAQENFTGIRVIKAFVKENQQIHSFAKVALNNKNVDISFARVSVIFDVLIEVIIALILSLLMAFGGWFAFSFATGNPINVFGVDIKLNAGQLVEFIGYFDTLIWPLIALGQLVTMHSKGKTSLGRIVSYLNVNEDVKDSETAVDVDIKGKITFDHLFFSYPHVEEHNLEDINLIINPGEKIGIVGKIGCGKSTLANSLLRLYNVTPRSILIDDVDIMDIKLKCLRDNIAIVPQDNFLFSDTIESNITFSNKALAHEKAVKAAQFADVDANINDFKEGYNTVTGERGVTLSGGQKQRISLARAFIKDAPILILDDSVSAVDLKTEETILDNIDKYREGKTTIVVASRVSTVHNFDRIIVMNEGKVEAFDTPKNLMKVSPTYQKMVYLQKLEKEVESR